MSLCLDLLEYIAQFADIDTRRFMGFAPLKISKETLQLHEQMLCKIKYPARTCEVFLGKQPVPWFRTSYTMHTNVVFIAKSNPSPKNYIPV